VVYRALPKTVTATNRRHLLLRGRAARPCHGAALGLPHPELAGAPGARDRRLRDHLLGSSVNRATGEPSQATTWGQSFCWIWSCVSQEGWTAASVAVRVWCRQCGCFFAVGGFLPRGE
jgi:hypothetical protein